jgi:hypothetical protein
MKLTGLPIEIVYEIATQLNIEDIKQFEIALNIDIPEYVFVIKYKEIFNQSVNKIDQITYEIKDQYGSDATFRSSGEYDSVYTCADCLGDRSLTVTRSGGDYSFDHIDTVSTHTNYMPGVKRHTGIIGYIETAKATKSYYVRVINL